MPSAFDQLKGTPKKVKLIKSAYDSESFDADGTIHVDGLVGSATISPSGRDVALASPEGLAIIDLDSPYSPPRRLSSHGLPWLVVDVQWSPFAARDYWVASTANHRCLVWNLNLRDDSTSGAIEHSLQGHSRAITDINFSAHHPDSLATCSVDGYVHCWDLRRPRQPAITFCDWFAGATQVKYSRQDPCIIASSHDRWLHIWDERKVSEPLRSISAHTSKIYGIDWNRTRASAIVTCSLDKSIKFWDYEKEGDVPERVIRTDFPVWRARHTPFGLGLLAMPQNEPGHLYLFDQREHDDTPYDGPVEPVATFEGHGEHKAKEFLWRTRGVVSEEGIDNREFQLVSWGEDNKLRLTRPEPTTLEGVGYVRGMEVGTKLKLTRQGATYKTFRTVDDGKPYRRTATMSDPHTSGKRQSALTLGMKVPSYRTGPSWRGPSMKAKSTGSRKVDKSQAQMNWMKGINMTKRKSSSDSPGRTGSKDSAMFGPFLQQDSWGEPETLQEEFVRISEQLPNVKWDSIDMDNLILNASLKGPWGVDEEDIFLKVTADIPHTYPKSKAPKFSIEKNAFMPDGIHEKLQRETHEIGEQYLKRKQNCLAAAFSYLLGETNLAESTNFFKNVRDLDDGIDALVDESSSEESDNDIPAGGSASMSQDLSASTEIDTTLAPISRPTVPPVYRTCGARFSNDGRLVTFFPTKEAKALLFSPHDTLKEKPKDQPTFAGFGRLSHDSTPPRKRYLDGEASATDDLSAVSDDSDDSSSSSDSEMTSMHKISLWYRPGRRLHKTWSVNESLRSSGGGTGAGTGTGTGTSRRRAGRAKNVIKCFDLRDMLPSKQYFAEEYAIFGDGAQVCEHNARVAEKYGYSDLVHIWKYASLLLRSDIPLEVREQIQKHQSVLIIAKDALSRYHDDKSPINESERLSGRVKWGHHPIAQEFVHNLFDYFEQLADIQMLAMLSCIFGESSTEDPISYAESHLPEPDTPLPMKAPSFSLEYFPTDAIDWSLAQPRSGYSSGIQTPYISQTPLVLSDPQSPDILWMGDPGSQSYSTGETPPHRFFKDYLNEIDQTQSLSTSPNDRSAIRRSQSALASTLTSGLTRGFASASMVSASPPGRKRPSPAETILSHIPTNITWGTSTYFGGQAESTETGRTSASDDESRRDELVSMIPVSVNVTMENETAFDDDGWLSTPLLEPSRNLDYASYRYAYAEMLQMWRLPLARLEIMKFNVFKDDPSTSPKDGTPSDSLYRESAIQDSSSHSATGTTSPTILLGSKRRSQLAALQASGRGLDVTGICRLHELQLQPLQYSHPSAPTGGAVGTCERCRRTQTQLTCVFCHEPVAALYAACLGCGCATHEGCLSEWHAMGEMECPAGDDCECSEEADKGQVETWVAMQAAMRETDRMRKPHTSHGERGRDVREQQHGRGDRNGVDKHLHGAKSPTPSTTGGSSGLGIGSKAAGLATRLRRRSAPAPFSLTVEDTDEEPESAPPSPPSRYNHHHHLQAGRDGNGVGGGGGGDDAASVVSVRSSSNTATTAAGSSVAPAKPSPLGPGTTATTSAARVSLGNRLRGLDPSAARPSVLRRKSGGNGGWAARGDEV